MRGSVWIAACAGLMLGGLTMPAMAKEVTVTVDARSPPWNPAVNPKMRFGLGDGVAPTVVWQLGLLPGLKLRIAAIGTTSSVPEGRFYGPEGRSDWTRDYGVTLLPNTYIPRAAGLVHLNQLVGCFVDADGRVVGKPFPIGTAAEVEVPQGAVALSLGINDDRFSDNNGSLKVTVSMPDPKVTVEGDDAAR